MSEKLVNININFDSLFFPLSIDRKSMVDPSFLSVADRFFAFANKYNFKYTIFIIGKDLENTEVAARVREWSLAGHEIGNHSYTHNPNLGALSKSEIEYEVVKSHEMITQCIGHEPRGFIAPSWSTSPDLIQTLIDNNYLYDTSIFPSYFQFLILLKLMLITKNKHKTFDASFKRRRDKLAFFFAPRKPYFIKPESLIKKQKDGLLMLPLPVISPLRVPCWHTMYYVFGVKVVDFLIRQAMKYCDDFYYLFHPRDLVDFEKDLSKEFKAKYKDEFVFESLDVPIADKMKYAEHALEIIAKSGRKFVTLQEIAKRYYEKKN